MFSGARYNDNLFAKSLRYSTGPKFSRKRNGLQNPCWPPKAYKDKARRKNILSRT